MADEEAAPAAPVETETPKKSVDDIAKEVVAGKWNRGQRRKKALQDAGYDPNEVKKAVDKIFGRS